MKTGKHFLLKAALLPFFLTPVAYSAITPIEKAKRETIQEIQSVIEPLFDKYCGDQCKVLSIQPDIQLSVEDEIAPGFDQVEGANALSLEPASVHIKVLIDEMIGKNSLKNLLELVQKHLDVFSYPVFIEKTMARFPQSQRAAQKAAELKGQIENDFKEKINQIIQQFCPQQCLLGDVDMQVDPVNAEEAQYGSSSEFVQSGETALYLRKVGATLLVDTSLTAEEQLNLLEMARLKTNNIKNVELAMKSMRFPENRAALLNRKGATGAGAGEFFGYSDAFQGTKQASSQDLKSTSDSKTTKAETTNQSTNTRNSESNSSNSNSRTNSNNNSNSTSRFSENSARQDRYERYEKIERVEDGDAVQAELEKIKVGAILFACAVLALLVFIAISTTARSRSSGKDASSMLKIFQVGSSRKRAREAGGAVAEKGQPRTNSENLNLIAKRYEIEQLKEELMKVYAEQPRVAKLVFSRILREEGVEVTAQYVFLFGEAIVIDILRDPSLQSDLNELMDYYVKTSFELTDEETLELLKALHNRTVAAKMVAIGNRSGNLFDFLVEMDHLQILELIRNESLTVTAIVLTQCNPQKRQAIYGHLDASTQLRLLTELSRIDHLPREYIYNVANALKRKRKDNPKLDTETLPGSDVLVHLLERADFEAQRTVLNNLTSFNPDSARQVLSKIVSLDTLLYLRDSQLLEIVLGLKHDELLRFLKGAPQHIRNAVLDKSPKELVDELKDELSQLNLINQETYQAIERKVINRIKALANDGSINLIEINERMFSKDRNPAYDSIQSAATDKSQTVSLKQAAGW